MITEFQRFDLFGKTTFVKAKIKPPYRLVADMNDEACFFYICEGETTMFSPTERVDMVQNEGLVLQCGTYLNEFFKNKNLDHCEAIAVHLFPEVLKRLYDKELPDFMKDLRAIEPVSFERVKTSKLVSKYIESLQFYFNNPELVTDELLKIKLKELLLLLAKTDNVDIIKSLISGSYSPEAIDFKEVIESNLYNNFSLEELSSLTNRSLSSFKRDFRKHYGSTPAKYIKSRKLNRAEQLLKSTDLPITQLAFETGFNDLAHFSKCFQGRFGSSPRKYRKEAKMVQS